jgi:hypothetical protein
MPIRFRCQYCNQLLGIARRKAGTRVECPTCHAQVLVPDTSAGAALPAAAPAPGAAAPPLFERSDFEDFLRPQVPAVPPAPPAPALPPLAPPGDRPSAYDVERLDMPSLGVATPPRPAGGIVLSPSQATVLTVAAVFLLAVAFGAGLLVGRFCF